MAKFAAKLKKPDGITILNIKKAKQVLQNYLVTELCGVSKGIQTFLNAHNVYTCGDMKKIPISILGNRYGNIDRAYYHKLTLADFYSYQPTHYILALCDV